MFKQMICCGAMVACLWHAEMTLGGPPLIPPQAGVLNVRDPQYGAVGDGVTDDTTAIQKALSAALDTHRIVYLPRGVYLVSDSLRWWRADYNLDKVNGWGAFTQLQGAGENASVLRLRDAAAGFTDPAKPKAVVATGSRGYHGNKHYQNGEGNEAFENHIRDLTIDIGQGNPGAIGIDYQVSNCGALRHVTIRSSDPSGAGAIGLCMTRKDNGPGLIDHLTIIGFDTGIALSGTVTQAVFEHILLDHPRKVGVHNRGAVAALRRLECRGAPVALVCDGISLTNLMETTLSGNAPEAAAISMSGTDAVLTLHDVKSSGYKSLVLNRKAMIPETAVAQWSSRGMLPDNGAAQKYPHTPVAETPGWAPTSADQWCFVGPPSGQDDTQAVQRALMSGQPAVYFAAGKYLLPQTIDVPPHVRLICGFGTEIDVKDKRTDDRPIFRFTGAKTNDLTVVDRLCLSARGAIAFSHQDERTLVVQDILGFGARVYVNQAGAGPVFFSDVASDGYQFVNTQAWARQWNVEGRAPFAVQAERSRIWALGFKREGDQPVLQARQSDVQMWGGLLYTFGIRSQTPPFVIKDCTAQLSVAGATFVRRGYYETLIRATQAGKTSEIRRDQIQGRGLAAVLPWYIASPAAEQP